MTDQPPRHAGIELGERGWDQGIEMFFIRAEGPDAPLVTQTDVDRLAGWVSAQLKKVGKAMLDRQEMTDLHAISVYDYLTLYQLPLDAYSLPETSD